MGIKDIIYVTMLGRFDILVNGNSVLPSLGNSSKSILLLKYLLLNRGKPITVAALIDMFWSEPDKSSNPESALKTMVSRIRSNLSKASPLLKDCILSEKKSYIWNPEIKSTIDAFEFEALYKELMEIAEFDETVKRRYIQALNLYGGDLSYSNSDEDWIVSRGLYLHHLYLKLVYRFIDLLKAQGDYETVIHVCRIALDIDAFDETLNLELMGALKEGGQNSAALIQYRHVTSVYHKYLGMEPSDRFVGFYKDLVKADLANESDINSIRQELQVGDAADNGAFVCDYSIFKDIYHLQLRNLERQESQMFLSLISVSRIGEEDFDPMLLDGVMREMLSILQGCLRRGDTIARYSLTQYAILLPMTNHSNGYIVINRIKKMFYAKYSDGTIRLSFQFGRVEQE